MATTHFIRGPTMTRLPSSDAMSTQEYAPCALHGCTFCARSLDRATVHNCLELHGLHGGSIDTVQPCRAVRPENGPICEKSLVPAPPKKSSSPAPLGAKNRKVGPPPAQPPTRATRSRLKQELRPASSFSVHARTAGKRGRPCGESHVQARHADDVVEHALGLYAAGMPKRQVARALGVARSTAQHWINGTRRRPPMRLVATRRPLGFTLPVLIGLADIQHPAADSQSSTKPAAAQDAEEMRSNTRSSDTP